MVGIYYGKVIYVTLSTILYQMDHGCHCAAIHLFNIQIARYFLSILHIHCKFIFIMVALFISPFPPQEIMYPRWHSATILFFQCLDSEIQNIFYLYYMVGTIKYIILQVNPWG